MFLSRNKKTINTFSLKSVPYLELRSCDINIDMQTVNGKFKLHKKKESVLIKICTVAVLPTCCPIFS